MQLKGIFVAIITVAFLSACSSSGSDSSSSTPVNTSTNGAPQQQQLLDINGGLTGLIWMAKDGQYFDVYTGDQTPLSSHQVFPSRDGKEYIELIEEYGVPVLTSCGIAYSDRLNIRNTQTGILQSSIQKQMTFYGPAKLSPDKQTIAFFAAFNEGCDSGDPALFLYSRSGEFIIRGNDGIGAFDWTPDNRLAFFYYSDDGVRLMLEATRNTLTSTTVLNLSDIIKHSPTNLELSPDGKTAVFEVVTGTPELFNPLTFREATVWRVNMDGAGLEKLIDSSRTETQSNEFTSKPRINQPTWSPDGRWLLATEDFVSGGIVTPVGPGVGLVDVIPVLSNELTYIVPAQTDFVRLPPESYSFDGIRPLLGRSYEGEPTPVSLNPIRDLRWTPSDVIPVEVAGEIPSTDAGINRGMSGTITSLNAETLEVLRYNVATDQLITTALSFNENTDQRDISRFAISPDGSRIVVRNLISHTNDHLLVFDADGQLVNEVDMNRDDTWYSVNSEIHLSPVQSNIAAARYVLTGNNGREGIVVFNVDTGEFIHRINDKHYQSLSFLPNGDLLVTSDGDIYRHQWLNGTFSVASNVLLPIGERIFELEANPVNSKLLYKTGQFYYTINLDGTNQQRVFSPIDDEPAAVRWSPDGQYLGFDWNNAFHVVSAVSSNVSLWRVYESQSVFEIDQSHKLGDRTETSQFKWY